MPCSWGFLGLIAMGSSRPSAAVGESMCSRRNVRILGASPAQPLLPHTKSVYTAWGTFALSRGIPPPALLLGSCEAADAGEPKKLPPN